MASRLAGEEVLARLSAQHAVARELLRAESVEQAAPGVLGAVATALGWEVAALWEVPEGASDLRLVELWEARAGLAADLRAASESRSFGRGAGLPGGAWDTGELTWVGDLAADPTFARWPAAARAGLRCGLAVPVAVGHPDDVVAVMEFFCADPAEPDTDLRELLTGFGDQLSQFIRRRRAELAREESAAVRSALVECALDCVITIDHRGRVAEFNPAAERTFGYRREEAVGRELAELIVPPELCERHRAGLARALETGEGNILDRRVELPGMRADGSRLAVELTVTRIPGVAPAMFAGFLRDVGSRQAAEHDQRHLAAIVESTDDAVISHDPDGLVTAWNPGAERLYGYRAEETVGRHISFLVPEDRRGEDERLLASAIEGARIEGFETQRMRADGARIDVSLTVSPIVYPVEGVTGASIIARDVTARKRAARTQEFLAAASAALDASLDPDQTLTTIARTAVPDLAELCVIDLLREDGSIGDTVAAAAHPSLAEELEEVRRRYPLRPEGSHPVAEVLRTGRSMVVNDLSAPSTEAAVAQSDQHRDYMRRAGYSSAAVLPLRARGRLLGAASLLHVRNDCRYDPSELPLLEDLAARAAMAYDNARLYAERSEVARTLQRSLLPPELPAVPGFTLAASYQPAGEGNEVGGDFYDVFASGTDWMVIVGDVCGKGAAAAAVTALIRNSVRALALESEDPADILDQVNEVMLRHELGGRFASAVLGRLEPATESGPRLCVSVAGHPPPLVVSADGTVAAVGGRGDLLGVRLDACFENQEVWLRPADRLVLYTDGVLDAGAPARVMGPDDLAAFLSRCAGAQAAQVVRAIEEEALRRGEGSLRDDLAILTLGVDRAVDPPGS